MTVCAPKLGVRYFEAKGLVTESDDAPKTGVQTLATSLIAGYGTGLVSRVRAEGGRGDPVMTPDEDGAPRLARLWGELDPEHDLEDVLRRPRS